LGNFSPFLANASKFGVTFRLLPPKLSTYLADQLSSKTMTTLCFFIVESILERLLFNGYSSDTNLNLVEERSFCDVFKASS